MGLVKSNRTRGADERNTLFSRDEYKERSRNVVRENLVGAFRCSNPPMIESTMFDHVLNI